MNPDPSPSVPEFHTPPRGLLFVITGASGVGKGTLRERWLAGQDVFYSVSWTTREARPGEQDGVHYHFKTHQEFLANAAQDGFLEHAEFVGNRYGTPSAPIEQALARGQDVILEIEVEGAMQVKSRLGEQAILIFIMPPSLAELRRRLIGRATETPERIAKRLARARVEIMQAHDFRYVIVNDTVDQAVRELHAVQRAEHARQHPQSEWTDEDRAATALAASLRSETWSQAALQDVIHRED